MAGVLGIDLSNNQSRFIATVAQIPRCYRERIIMASTALIKHKTVSSRQVVSRKFIYRSSYSPLPPAIIKE